MIPDISKLAVENSKMDFQNKVKQKWLRDRDKAYDYYKGRTKSYTRRYFSPSTIQKVPCPNVNLTKRIIDRVSLVYMKSPVRSYTNEDVVELLFNKDFKLQRAERLCNLLEVILIKPTWRNGQVEYDIIRDWEPRFDGEAPLEPTAITYPLSVRSTVLDTTPEIWAYWDAENHFMYEKDTHKYIAPPDNPDMINPYGILPFVECYRDGRPEAAYFDTDASPDLIATNELINVASFNMAANNQFQSFGIGTITGSNIEKDRLEIGQDKWAFLGVDGQLNMVAPPNSVPALVDSINASYKLIAQNYHLSISFVESASAESGVALRLRNQELMDSRKSDVERWKSIEFSLFEIEKAIVNIELNKDIGELENVDYEESTEILSDEEQRAKWDWELEKEIINKVDILMEKDPDKFPERQDALDYLSERKAENALIGQVEEDQDQDQEQSPLLANLITPV